MRPSKDIVRLIEIMAALRDPHSGCPWDIEQDFNSIAPYTIEEAYEVADAIERSDLDDLREELGDLLLQVVYHARMAEEKGFFRFDDVVEVITEKMIRRHPHVFGDKKARSSGMARGAWDRIKEQEKAVKSLQRQKAGLPEKQPPGLLADIPRSLPALTRALKIQNKAARVGFDWDNPQAVIEKVREELDELEIELESGNLQNTQMEFGDVLFTLTNLARHIGFDPETALRNSNGKIIKRFEHIETELAKQGISLEDASQEEMETLWQAAKTL